MWLGVWAKARIKFRRVFTNNRACERELYLFYEGLKIHPDKHLVCFIVFAEIISDYAANGALPNFIRLFFIATLILGVLGLKRAKQ